MPIRTKNSPLNILEKREHGRIQGLHNFLGSSIILETGKATNVKFCAHIYRLTRNKSTLKISEKVAVGVVRDSRKFSGAPLMYMAHPIISGTGKATDFKFGQYIQSVHPNKKSPLNILEKGEHGRIQGLPIFWVAILS